MEFIMPFITNGALAVLAANLITLFLDDAKIAKYGPIAKTILSLLNAVSLNVAGNKNKTDV